MLCDIHTHLYDEPDYAEALAETAKNLGFDKLCIGGGESRYGIVSNDDVLECAQTYPDLFVPFAVVRLGIDGPAAIEEFGEAGFKGIRVYGPPAPYDEIGFFSVYETVQALKMPVLFHTGFLPRTPLDRALDVRVDNMRPVCLDTIARQFPALKIIGCGLGAPWFEEASETLRRHENVYFDLSGEALRRKGAEFYRGLLGSETTSVLDEPGKGDAWSRILLGTAVRCEEIASVERNYQRLFRALALRAEVVEDIVGGNAQRLLGVAQEQ